MPDHGTLLLAGTANPTLGLAIANALGIGLGARRIERFPDGEVSVELAESVRGRDVFLMQPTSAPVNDHLVELLALADACRRAGADRIVAVIPYFGYARGDKRDRRRVPVTGRVAADLLESVGIEHVVTVDAHTPQLEGFFRIPTDDLSAVPALVDALRPHVPDEAVIVSPDLGGVRRAAFFSSRLGRPAAVCVKQRTSGADVAVTQVIGDVRDRLCVIVDDMITTGATISEATKALVENGAHRHFVVAATHGVLTEGALAKLDRAGVVQLVLADTIALAPAKRPPLTTVTVAPLLAEVIRRLQSGESLRDLY